MVLSLAGTIRRCLPSAALALAVAGALSVGRAAPPEPAPEKAKFFDAQVKPILEANCVKCHGGEKIKGGLVLTDRDALLKGGDTGPAVSLDHPAGSLLLKAVGYGDPDLQMPPKQKLTPDQVVTLNAWVEMGAPMTPMATSITASGAENPARKLPPQVNAETMKFWSFQPVKRPAIPAVKRKEWVKTPIDAFVLAKLEANHLSPAAPASKTVLLRRAYYDLTGLPPTPEDVENFIKDNAPDAFEKVVDRLLASPRYGERWARHWLDVVRFSETNSFERDGLKPNAWRFRDYVIESFNKDKPYDQFVKEQLAGDELNRATADGIVATGYYRLGIWDDEPADREQAQFDQLDDLVTTTAQGFLGLTVNCARCHDHKLDPIPQKDYYRMVSFFRGIRPYSNGESILTEIAPDDQIKAVHDESRAANRHKADLRRQIAEIERPVLAALPGGEKSLPTSRKGRHKALNEAVLKAIGDDPFKNYAALTAELEEIEARKPSTPLALSVKETGPRPPATFVMARGNAHVPGDQVEPAFLSILNPPRAEVPAPKSDAATSGRRRVLADWIASERNPLAARVMVNRIFQHHFGRGIVRSSNDFGSMGDRPTHPELLDWLASEFVAQGWKMKPMHRMIVLSNAYRMSSTAEPGALAKDPRNDLLWRFDMRRLEAEEVRDSILAVDGRLNLEMGGPGVYPTIPAEVLAGQSRPGEGWGKSSPQDQARRSIYVHQKRSLVVPIVESLDAADNDGSCPVRFTTTQSTQALGMLNSDFTNEEAAVFAARLRKEAGGKLEDQVRLALRLATCHEPGAEDVARGVKFATSLERDMKVAPEVALKQFCLLVLNLNEFVYLD